MRPAASFPNVIHDLLSMRKDAMDKGQIAKFRLS